MVKRKVKSIKKRTNGQKKTALYKRFKKWYNLKIKEPLSIEEICFQSLLLGIDIEQKHQIKKFIALYNLADKKDILAKIKVTTNIEIL